MLTQSQQQLAAALLEIQALKFGAFRMKLHQTNPDAPLSPVYLDLRILRTFPAAIDASVVALTEVIHREHLNFELLADVPTAATPFVAVLSHHLRAGMISPRKELKSYGTGNPIDGAYQPGQRVLVVDDVITAASSKFETIAVLEASGLRVKDVLVLVDREQGGRAELERHGYNLYSCMTFDALMQYARDSGTITAEQYNEVRAYFESSRITPRESRS